MPPHLRPALALATAVVVALLVGACGSDDDWSGPHADPTPVGALGAGFLDVTPPPPESTVTPSPGSWDDVHPSEGYRVVLLTSGDDDPTRTLVDAVHRWADDEDVSLKTVTNTEPHRILDDIADALALEPDLVISAGDPLVDPMAAVTANHLSQQFLVVGAELAEPTHNVTAADWTGASYRGEGLGMSSAYDASSFTPERADRAVRAGVASVLSGVTGIVLWLD